MTADGGIRIIAACTTMTARGAAAAQSLEGAAATRLGELITGAVLLREAMSPGQRVQLILRDGQGGSVVADSHPEGWSRGVVNAAQGDSDGEDPVLTVCRTLATGSLHQGIVSLPDDGDISRALMQYMHSSEQIVTTIAVAAVGEAVIDVAGGYLVQLLPGAHEDDLRQVTERLESVESVDSLLRRCSDAQQLISAVLGDIEHSPLGDGPLRFGCNCSRERLIAGIDSLADTEIMEIKAAGDDLEVRCDACGTMYQISPTELREA